MQGHHQLFQGGVTGPLADAVDGALQLSGAGFRRREHVSYAHAQVVVTVCRDRHPFDTLDILAERAD